MSKEPETEESAVEETLPSWELPRGGKGGPVDAEVGEYERRTALLLAIVGLIYLPIFFGPLALYHARKAAIMGFPAERVVILGWVEMGLGILQVLLVVGFVLVMRGMLPGLGGLRFF